jgi:hypothetical protein
MRQYALLKRRSAPTRLQGTISQKAVIFLLAAVRTRNLTGLQRLIILKIHTASIPEISPHTVNFLETAVSSGDVSMAHRC